MTDTPPTRRTPPASVDASGAAEPGGAHPGGDERPEDRAGREPGELVVALSPRQIIGGFALLAGLIIWLRRRGRKG